jgi:hypothetical protein
MEKQYCAHCIAHRDLCDLTALPVKRYRRFDTLYFCKDKDCFKNYTAARQSLSQIKRVQSNIRNYSIHKSY